MTLREERTTTTLDHLAQGRPLSLPQTVTIDGSSFIPIGLDNGNGHTKAALLNHHGRLITQIVPTVYRAAKEIRGGQRITTYCVDDGPAFWIGSNAILEGDALPIGSTAERLSDRRQREFLVAVLVESLITAGYKSGIHNLLVGLAIPNQEIVLSDNGNKLGVAKDTRQALKDYLLTKSFNVKRTNTHGETEDWTVVYSKVMPQAQSIGTYVAWANEPSGKPVDTGIEALTVIDIGTGDLQRTDIDLAPYRMSGEKLGRGTITMARALSQKLNMGLNDAQAMTALVTGTVIESGIREDIRDVVNEVVESEGQDLIARLLPTLQQRQRYVIFTGGGVLLDGLRDAIEERAAAAGKLNPRNYTFVPGEHALTLNATGAMLAVIYAAATQGA